MGDRSNTNFSVALDYAFALKVAGLVRSGAATAHRNAMGAT
jgi:hypothetical protein